MFQHVFDVWLQGHLVLAHHEVHPRVVYQIVTAAQFEQLGNPSLVLDSPDVLTYAESLPCTHQLLAEN